jgi:subtilisin family serine protease
MYRSIVPLSLLLTACSTDFSEDPNAKSLIDYEKVSLDKNQTVDINLLDKNIFDKRTILAKPKLNFNQRFYQNEQVNVREYISALQAEVLQVPNGVDPIEMIEDLRVSGEYEYVEPNYTVRLNNNFSEMAEENGEVMDAQGHPTAELDDYQWNLSTIGFEGIPANVTGTGITIALIDTGFAPTPTTPINILSGHDFVNHDEDALDDNGHGTHIAGIISHTTQNNMALKSISPDVDILPIKSLDANGNGTHASIASGIVYAVDNGAHLIHISAGGEVSSKILADAVDYATQHGVTIIAAAGNHGSTTISFPAAYENVTAVGSVGFLEDKAYYSNTGRALDFVAPGGDMRFDNNDDGFSDGILQKTLLNDTYTYKFYQGTATASSHVVASYALLLSEGASSEQIGEALRNTTIDLGPQGWDSQYGNGLIQIDAAYDSLFNTENNNKIICLMTHKQIS